MLPAVRDTPARPAPGRWRLAKASPRGFSWREAFARALDCEALIRCDVATVLEAARAAAAGVTPEPNCWVATPVHLLPGLTQVHAPLDAVLTLPQDEADELADHFHPVFGSDSSLRLLPVGSSGFLLHGLQAEGVTSLEPAALRGRNLEHCQPQGAGASRLRALMSEIEMWLHDLPLNRRRETRGLPSISSLWLWGAGASAGAGAWPRDAGHRLAVCASDDPWVEAACELLGLVQHDLPQTAEALWQDPLWAREPEGRWIVVLAGCDLSRLEHDWLAPLCRALSDGRLGRVQIETADQSLSLARRDRWRLWRQKASPLQRLVLQTGAT